MLKFSLVCLVSVLLIIYHVLISLDCYDASVATRDNIQVQPAESVITN